tara:strand:- start:2606 stop:3109 length:504 start_codon:yes stop_codon:yes gene_type:complete
MNKKLYIQETINWISQNDFDFLITLHFTEEVGRAKTEKALTLFLNKLNNDVFGNRSSKSLIQVPFIERNSYDNSFHIHILCENPAKRGNRSHFEDPIYFRKLVKKCWRFSAPEAAIKNMKIHEDNPLWIKRIDDQKRLISYLLKQIAIDNLDVVEVDKLNFEGQRRF